MGLDFITRALRTTALVGLILFPFLLYYFGLWQSMAWLSGVIWGGLNLVVLTSLVTNSLRPDGVDRERTAIFSIIKFPLLYGSGFALLMIEQFPVGWLLLGSAMPLLIMVMKAVGRSISANNRFTLSADRQTSKLVNQ